MKQKPFTAKQREALIKGSDTPIVKLFCPWGPQTWLISEYDPDTGIMFGLADLGFGCPEMGDIYLPELEALQGPFGLTVERDMHFNPTMTLEAYADEARAKGRIDV